MSPVKKAGHKKSNKSMFSMDQSTAREGDLRNSSSRPNVMSIGDMKNTLRSSLLDQNMKTYTSGNGKDEFSPRGKLPANLDVGKQPFGKPRPSTQISPKKTPGKAGAKTPLQTDQHSKRSSVNLNQTIN